MACEVPVISETAMPAIRRRTCLRIGDVVMGLEDDSADQVFLGAELDFFRVHDCHADLEVCITWAQSIKAWRGKPIFDSGAVWKLFADGDELVFDFVSVAL